MNQSIPVPKVLNDQQVSSFVEDGYMVMNELISHEECEEIVNDSVKIIRGEYFSESNYPDIAENDTDEDVLKKVLCIHQPHFHSPTINKYVAHPKICGILSQITGAHLVHWNGNVKCMQSMYFIKPPGYQGQAWHQDEIYIPTRDRSLIGAWIALEDATIENGCLWVLPKSHQDGILYDQKPHENDKEFDFADQSYGFDDSNEIPVEVKKGSVVFFNGYLLHRSAKNRSNNFRKVLVNHYMSANSLLPWTGEASRADERCVQLVAGNDYYAYKGYTKKGLHFRMCSSGSQFYNKE